MKNRFAILSILTLILVPILAFAGDENDPPMATMPAMKAAVNPTTAEEQTVRDMVLDYGVLWNKHDMKGLASMFGENADFITADGHYWKGREEIEARHITLMDKRMKKSTLNISQVWTRFLTPDLALVHSLWELHGDKEGPQPRLGQVQKGVSLYVIERLDGQWKITDAHNSYVPNETIRGY
jgi:uncharacterized protein (TIGR02246 family)